ncbi:hypothetical protein V525_17290 [Gordonia alkanivorans CGMCC 6845]|uniref:PLD phosphodiesterase domain-containing protein n=1 Tax=Gordonia alkanivorans CGMCC 6845 TaxID=1423140 RepID=W9DBA3_9ACTN|nr:hypothetical protein V525_17290 [Gordonia alkanivorans CGMCC 6845]
MVVVDAEMVLIGSANITGTALLRNIECGVLLRDQSVAGEIITTINTLVSRGELMTY